MPLWCDFCRDTGYFAAKTVSLRGKAEGKGNEDEKGKGMEKEWKRNGKGMEKECVAGGSLLDCDDGDGGVADCVGAVEREDFVEFFADG